MVTVFTLCFVIKSNLVCFAQDIDAFSDESFDAVAWINASFKDYDQRQPKEVSTLYT